VSVFKCPVCGFVQCYSVLHAESGDISDNPKQKADDVCPNDGAILEIVPDKPRVVNGGKS
jgi:hypothetical protein